MDDPPVQHVVIDQDGYIGLNDTTPTASLSVSGNIVMLNQSGIYFNEVGNASDYPALIATQNQTQIHSSEGIRILNPDSQVVFSVVDHGVAINTVKLVDQIDSEDIGFEIAVIWLLAEMFIIRWMIKFFHWM